MSHRLILLTLGCLLANFPGAPSRADEVPPTAELVSVRKIWDVAPHNAFTDLIRWRDVFYCAFREGKGHAGDIGVLRILRSVDGEHWESTGLLSMPDYDLRDAAISALPDGRLMVLGGVQRTFDGTRRTGTFVSFSEDGEDWSAPRIVVDPGRWLWRVTWHGDTAYGVAYGAPDNPGISSLLATRDGVEYKTVVTELLNQGGRATEARVRFDDDGTGYILHRRDAEPNSGYLGIAAPPYTDWQWFDLGVRIGGPNFMRIPSGDWIAAARLYDGGARTELLWLDVDRRSLQPILRLPSGGDTSYPGMVWHDGLLWVSYYSSHEGRTSIYLAKVRLP